MGGSHGSGHGVFVLLWNTAFGLLIQQSTEFAATLNEAEDYLSIIIMFEVGFGIAFQLPLVIFYLAILHVVPYKDFRQ